MQFAPSPGFPSWGQRRAAIPFRRTIEGSVSPLKNVPAEVTQKGNEVFRAIVARQEKIEEVIDRIVEQRR